MPHQVSSRNATILPSHWHPTHISERACMQWEHLHWAAQAAVAAAARAAAARRRQAGTGLWPTGSPALVLYDLSHLRPVSGRRSCGTSVPKQLERPAWRRHLYCQTLGRRVASLFEIQRSQRGNSSAIAASRAAEPPPARAPPGLGRLRQHCQGKRLQEAGQPGAAAVVGTAAACTATSVCWALLPPTPATVSLRPPFLCRCGRTTSRRGNGSRTA